MKKINFFAGMACVFLLSASLTAKEGKGMGVDGSGKLTVAVTDLVAKGLDKSVADIFSERFRSELIQTGYFRVMERGQMDMVLKEQGFQQSGACSDEACLVEMGQIMGVERMIAGSMGKLGSLYTISVRLINVETGEILTTANEDCDCEIKNLLSKTVPALAGKMAQAAGFKMAAPAMAAAAEPAPQATKEKPAESPGTYTKRTMLGHVFLGSGALLGIGAAVVFLGAESKYKAYNDIQDPDLTAEMDSRYQEYKSGMSLTYILAAGAAALMAPSIYFYTAKVKVEDVPAPAKTKLSLAPQPLN